jgi:hypothetical protein
MQSIARILVWVLAIALALVVFRFVVGILLKLGLFVLLVFGAWWLLQQARSEG